MRKRLILLFLALIVCGYSFSQSTLTITSEQLKVTTLIFAEHQQLSEKLPLLETKIKNLELINNSWQHTDSIRQQQLYYCESVINDKNRSISQLKRSLKNHKVITYSSVAGVVIMLCLLLK